MFSLAAPHAKGKSAEDNIFAANNRAIALAEKIGNDKVVNGTVGSILDEDGNLVVLDVVKEALKELSPKEVLDIFQNEYVNREDTVKLVECHFKQIDGVQAELTILVNDEKKVYHGQGNGRLDAISNAIMKHFDIKFSLVTYEEHALQVGSDSQACAYVGLEVEGVNGIVWGAGIKSDIIDASAYALISALNRSNHMNK